MKIFDILHNFRIFFLLPDPGKNSCPSTLGLSPPSYLTMSGMPCKWATILHRILKKIQYQKVRIKWNLLSVISASQGTPPINRKNLIDYPPPRNEYTIHHHLLLAYYLQDSD